MDVTIALPTLNEEQNIVRCLKNLEDRIKEFEKGEVELILLDSHSEDNTVEIVRRFDIVDEIYEIPKGLLTARKEGFKKAKHNIVVCIDADAIYKDNWLNNLVKPFEEDGLVATYGKAKAEGMGMETIVRSIFNNILVECYMPGANRAIRKDAFFEIGGFDRIPENQNDIWAVMKETLYKLPRNLKKTGEVRYVSNAVSVQADRNLRIKDKQGGAQWEYKNLKAHINHVFDFLRYASSVKRERLKRRLRRAKSLFWGSKKEEKREEYKQKEKYRV